MKILRKIVLYYHTIKYLKLIQIYGRTIFLLKNSIINFFIKVIIEKKRYNNLPANILLKKKIYTYLSYSIVNSNHEFNFLNKKVHYYKTIIWDDETQEKLWLYNLHYFDYLFQFYSNLNKDNYLTAKTIILDWIENNPIGKGVGWESYPLSLRIVNWIFFYNYFAEIIKSDEPFKSVFLTSLYRQCWYLSFFIEYHLLANHLFKNGKALFIAGLFFNNKKWQKNGAKILRKEFKEQILPDGGHYERSPMYHAISLEDILDLINFIKSRGDIEIRLFQTTVLENMVAKMLAWLAIMVNPDGEIPLIGDSAFKIAPNFSHLCEYNKIVTGKSFQPDQFQKTKALPNSGYYLLRSNNQYMIVNGGELGVSYQPGHAHCDLLSFEYSLENTRVFIDAGIGNYEKSDIRQKARSVKAHNTVMVNNMEQGEIWAAFRMGRRVSPDKIMFHEDNGVFKFTGSYENKLNRRFAYRHRREILFYMNKFFIIYDYINSKNIEKVESYFHLAPDAKINLYGNKIEIKIEDKIVYLYLKNSYNVNIENWFYTPEFGEILNSKLLVLKPSIEKVTHLSYIICPKAYKSKAEIYIQKNWNI